MSLKNRAWPYFPMSEKENNTLKTKQLFRIVLSDAYRAILLHSRESIMDTENELMNN